MAAPDASGLVPGKPVVTTDAGKITVVGLDAGKSPDFELPAGSAQMTVTPCASNQVIPFVTLFDGKDNKLAIVRRTDLHAREPRRWDLLPRRAANPGCTWQIVISPG